MGAQIPMAKGNILYCGPVCGLHEKK